MAPSCSGCGRCADLARLRVGVTSRSYGGALYSSKRVGLTNWRVGLTNWRVGPSNWWVGLTNWRVGPSNWWVGLTNWWVGLTNWWRYEPRRSAFLADSPAGDHDRARRRWFGRVSRHNLVHPTTSW